MSNYKDMNVRQLYDKLVESFDLHLSGIDKSEEIAELKAETDARNSDVYDLAYNLSIEKYKNRSFPTIPEPEDLPDKIKQLNKHLASSNMTIAKVEGDSMINENIQTGNYVVYEKNLTPSIGEIGIFEYKNQILIKKYKKSDDKIYLESANRDYESIWIKESDKFVILGVVRFILKEI